MDIFWWYSSQSLRLVFQWYCGVPALNLKWKTTKIHRWYTTEIPVVYCQTFYWGPHLNNVWIFLWILSEKLVWTTLWILSYQSELCLDCSIFSHFSAAQPIFRNKSLNKSLKFNWAVLSDIIQKHITTLIFSELVLQTWFSFCNFRLSAHIQQWFRWYSDKFSAKFS